MAHRFFLIDGAHPTVGFQENTGSSSVGMAFALKVSSMKTNGNIVQIRIHGRGGQGVVTAAELISVAAFLDGKQAQAFPSFGSERTGAPVTAFCRISDHIIRSREPVYHPDVLILQDSTLLHQVDVFAGMSPQGSLLINSSRIPNELGIDDWLTQHPAIQCVTIPASQMAMKQLGRPIANTALVGGFAALTGLLTKISVQKAIRRKFTGSIGEHNASIAGEAYEYLASQMAPA